MLTFIFFSLSVEPFVCQMVFCTRVIAFAEQNNRQRIFYKFYAKTKPNTTEKKNSSANENKIKYIVHAYEIPTHTGG